MSLEKIYAMIIIKPRHEPIYAEHATHIGIADEAGGCFVEIRQEGGLKLGTIQIDVEEWPLIREAVEELLAECERQNGRKNGRKNASLTSEGPKNLADQTSPNQGPQTPG